MERWVADIRWEMAQLRSTFPRLLWAQWEFNDHTASVILTDTSRVVRTVMTNDVTITATLSLTVGRSHLWLTLSAHHRCSRMRTGRHLSYHYCKTGLWKSSILPRHLPRHFPRIHVSSSTFPLIVTVTPTCFPPGKIPVPAVAIFAKIHCYVKLNCEN